MGFGFDSKGQREVTVSFSQPIPIPLASVDDDDEQRVFVAATPIEQSVQRPPKHAYTMLTLNPDSACDVCAEEYGPMNLPRCIPCGE